MKCDGSPYTYAIMFQKGKNTMIYPEFLKNNDTIGICAPSQGTGGRLPDLEKSLSVLHSHGFKTKETASVRSIQAPCSTSAEERGKELNSLFLDPEIKMIMCAAGGDFMDEMIPCADFDLMRKNPKWLSGASDPTSILYPYTVLYDVATLYGVNAINYNIAPWPVYLEDSLSIIKGRVPIQKSSKRRLSKPPFMTDDQTFDIDSQWKSTAAQINVKGRCIGGCMDSLKDLIGTKYDGTLSFLHKYREDGVIWYLDNFSLSADSFYRTLLQMRYAGWLDTCHAAIIGRVCFPSTDTGMSYEDAIHLALKDIPVLYEADIGHTVPCMTMINGALMHLQYDGHEAAVSFELK